jgi:3-oxoadipate enol-lactonase
MAPGDRVQEAFVRAGAMQCGYCTPGFVLMVHDLLRTSPDPTDAQIEAHLASNTCRCGAYPELAEAVRLAVRDRAAAGDGGGAGRDGRPQLVSVRGGLQRLAVRRQGEGPPLVLLHSLAMAGAMWEGAVAALADRFEVVTVDVRGHGASQGDGRPFTVEDIAGDLAELLDALGIERTSLLGLSMGGSVAVMFAALFADRVDRLVLADTTANYGPDRVESWEERARTAVERPRDAQLDFQVERWFSPAFRDREPDAVRRIGEIFVACDSQVHAAACRALGALDANALLGDIRAPTFVLVGEEDYATPPDMARALAEGIPDARLSVLPGVRHMSLIERPDLWEEIAAFLAS